MTRIDSLRHDGMTRAEREAWLNRLRMQLRSDGLRLVKIKRGLEVAPSFDARYLQRRIDALSVFLGHCVRHAVLDNDCQSWHSQHVVWAINRLAALGYGFPETAPNAYIPRRLRAVA